MRPETKEMITSRCMKKLEDGSMQYDRSGEWVHSRNIRSIIRVEVELLQKTCDKRKKEIEYWKNKFLQAVKDVDNKNELVG